MNIMDVTLRESVYYGKGLSNTDALEYLEMLKNNISNKWIQFVEIGYINNDKIAPLNYDEDYFNRAIDICEGIYKATAMMHIPKADIARWNPEVIKRLSLVRVVVGQHVPDELQKYVDYFHNLGVKISVNLTYVVGLPNDVIVSEMNRAEKMGVDYFFCADSSGSFSPSSAARISKLLVANCGRMIPGVHLHDHMKAKIHEIFHVPMEKMISLQIFDYLYQSTDQDAHASIYGPIVVAGNLDRRKSGYVYNLPLNIKFDLFGANVDESFSFHSNVNYRGKVKPDVLPSLLKGSFGLVWDGPSADTCAGVYGEYLKINNPHKTSLYLASGLPVIVWRQSAIADFVEKNGCGWAVDNLQEIEARFTSLTPEKYSTLVENAQNIGRKLRTGYYLQNAIRCAKNN